MPVSVSSELFTSYILTIDIYSETHKYKKMPNKVIHAWQNITEKMSFLKMCGPQIWLIYV